MAFIHAVALGRAVTPGRQTARTTPRRPTFRAASWRASAATGTPIDANTNANTEPDPEAQANSPTDATQPDGEREWRPHIVNAADVDESQPSEMPVELAEGFLPDGGTRPKLDLDADEVMMMWKMRRMLHEDDYKRIFDNPKVGEI